MKSIKEVEIVQHIKMNYLEIFLLDMITRHPHGHGDLEIGMVLDGSLNMFLENDILLLKKGDIYIVNHYQVHSFSGSSKENLILAFQIDAELYIKINPSLNFIQFDSQIIHSGVLHDAIYSQLLSCAMYYFKEGNKFELHCASILFDILYQLLSSTHCHVTNEKEDAIAKNNSLRINRITDYINQNYASRISLKDIAQQENITICHASHFIKKMLGISFQEYLNNVRFNHAFHLVNRSNFNILDICLETGFSSSKYLNQIFKAKLGCTVKEYLKSDKKPVIIPSPSLPVDNIQRRYTIEKAINKLDIIVESEHLRLD